MLRTALRAAASTHSVRRTGPPSPAFAQGIAWGSWRRSVAGGRRQLATIRPDKSTPEPAQKSGQWIDRTQGAEQTHSQTAVFHTAAPEPASAESATAHDSCTHICDETHKLEHSIREFLGSTRQRPRAGLKPDELLVKCPVCSPGKARRLAYMAHLNTTTGSFVCTGCFEQGSWEKYQELACRRNFQNSIPKGSRTTDPAPFEFAEETLVRLQENLVRHEEIYTALTGREKGQLRLRPDVLARYGVGLGFINPEILEVKELSELVEASDHAIPCLVFPRTAFRTNSFIEGTNIDTQTHGTGSSLSSILNDTKDTNEVHASNEAPGSDPLYTDADGSLSLSSPSLYRVVQLKMVGWDTTDLEMFFPVDEAQPGLFGFHVAQPSLEEVILAGNELDALAAFQETGIPAVSLPKGPYQLPLDAMRALERFERVYVWLDDDHQGAEAAKLITRKLGVDRCLVVSTQGGNPHGPKSASIALGRGHNLVQILEASRPVQHDKVLNFSALREAVKFEVTNPELIRGVESKDLPGWNACFKGLRPGELTILSGATGCGKTTVISQMSLDFCKSGVSTLWGSFEIPNVRLATRMLSQFVRRDISKKPDEIDYWSRKFEQLPLYFLKFHGSTQPETVLETMRHAVYAYDVKHIVIDNLQFMMSMQAKGMDKYDAQDAAIATFRRFATEENVHITVVAHLRKDQPSSDADINSIFGSAKVTQEADNVVILQRHGGAASKIRCINILKNRFDGTLGKVYISYDSETLTFKEVPAPRRRKSVKVVKFAGSERLSMADRIMAEAAEMADSFDDGADVR
ncbi:hypothetical protein IW140_003570 [Coemansia sp. RSA 1813]|nr:hypothetical protein EV178_003462 [Coemansia sp. RSA 1646]KAJ1769308.1 hypothetical protein LPJ74_004135 [Coemansia sp. RSA 1843]KAJ2089121.1 hypothetical protein IW138_003701 [Coemansia sp. RSA 986]KAJ2215622.1 hypothetical protein EV179_002033 [Coemansia sp. RSA 487]KAJ2568813.1 hypothetical protein IW140_003570 [Coemansia sp. RSA 1813]